ncbi:methyltransferase domain-containing protein [Colletotrichum tofieldiae]|nr:methyltransferase domain-containing protein [Colletotrichum tofieldiae]
MAEERATSAGPEESSMAQPQAAVSTDGTAAADGAVAGATHDDHPAQQVHTDDDAEHPDYGYESASEGSSNASASLASSVRDYDFENTRRYHKYKEGQYHFPNDDFEQEREDMKHAMVRAAQEPAEVCIMHNVLFQVFLEWKLIVDDLVGDEYPEADVIGIDLSPIQPEFVPPNVHFFVDDAEVGWVYPENTFDYVHLRNMAPSIKKWPELFAEAYRVLKPGGWIELQEMRWVYGCDDGTMGPDFAPVRMVANIKEALAQLSVDMNAAERYPKHAEDAGFVDLKHEVKKVPVGPWPKDSRLKKIGDYCRAAIYDGLHAITIGPFTRGLDWSPRRLKFF